MGLAEGATFAALWQVAGHYIPAAQPHMPPTVTRRIVAYTWGVTGIGLGIGIAYGWRAMLRFFAIAAAAGAATVAVYGADYLANMPAQETFRRGFES